MNATNAMRECRAEFAELQSSMGSLHMWETYREANPLTSACPTVAVGSIEKCKKLGLAGGRAKGDVVSTVTGWRDASNGSRYM
jgi:hypothetical protein